MRLTALPYAHWSGDERPEAGDRRTPGCSPWADGFGHRAVSVRVVGVMDTEHTPGVEAEALDAYSRVVTGVATSLLPIGRGPRRPHPARRRRRLGGHLHRRRVPAHQRARGGRRAPAARPSSPTAPRPVRRGRRRPARRPRRAPRRTAGRARRAARRRRQAAHRPARRRGRQPAGPGRLGHRRRRHPAWAGRCRPATAGGYASSTTSSRPTRRSTPATPAARWPTPPARWSASTPRSPDRPRPGRADQRHHPAHHRRADVRPAGSGGPGWASPACRRRCRRRWPSGSARSCGLRLVEVVPGSPAGTAGLYLGDVLITAGGRPVQACRRCSGSCSARPSAPACRSPCCAGTPSSTWSPSPPSSPEPRRCRGCSRPRDTPTTLHGPVRQRAPPERVVAHGRLNRSS